MNWYTFQYPYDRFLEVQTEFENLTIHIDYSENVALFADMSKAPTETLYLSPNCQKYIPQFLKKHSAIPCQAPDKGSVALLVGDERHWDTLFPKSAGK